MEMDFSNIDYLAVGTLRQRMAYNAMRSIQILEKLSSFTPVLAGTVPINIDTEGSDLDVLCYCEDYQIFKLVVLSEFSDLKHFRFDEFLVRGEKAITANFWHENFEIEIYCQNIPVKRQMAYRHMLIEHYLLSKFGEEFRLRILNLKQQGYKTEPAFAMLLGLEGDPYLELLRFENEL